MLGMGGETVNETAAAAPPAWAVVAEGRPA